MNDLAATRYDGMPCRRCGRSGLRLPAISLGMWHNIGDIEAELLPALDAEDIGCIAYSPLAQGLLTDRYLGGRIPQDSGAARAHFLKPDDLTQQRLAMVEQLPAVAHSHGQTLAQLALAWVLRHPGMNSVLVGASRLSQLDDTVAGLAAPPLGAEELAAIDDIVSPA